MNGADAIENALTWSYDWVAQLAEDLSDAPMTQPTPRGGNHPTWVVGHLATSTDALLAMATGRSRDLEGWDPLFERGTEPQSDAGAYPSYGELLRSFGASHEASLATLRSIGESGLDVAAASVPDELREFTQFRSRGKVLLFIATHNMSHLGQLADARRALGRAPFG